MTSTLGTGEGWGPGQQSHSMSAFTAWQPTTTWQESGEAEHGAHRCPAASTLAGPAHKVPSPASLRGVPQPALALKQDPNWKPHETGGDWLLLHWPSAPKTPPVPGRHSVHRSLQDAQMSGPRQPVCRGAHTPPAPQPTAPGLSDRWWPQAERLLPPLVPSLCADRALATTTGHSEPGRVRGDPAHLRCTATCPGEARGGLGSVPSHTAKTTLTPQRPNNSPDLLSRRCGADAGTSFQSATPESQVVS